MLNSRARQYPRHAQPSSLTLLLPRGLTLILMLFFTGAVAMTFTPSPDTLGYERTNWDNWGLIHNGSFTSLLHSAFTQRLRCGFDNQLHALFELEIECVYWTSLMYACTMPIEQVRTLPCAQTLSYTRTHTHTHTHTQAHEHAHTRTHDMKT